MKKLFGLILISSIFSFPGKADSLSWSWAIDGDTVHGSGTLTSNGLGEFPTDRTVCCGDYVVTSITGLFDGMSVGLFTPPPSGLSLLQFYNGGYGPSNTGLNFATSDGSEWYCYLIGWSRPPGQNYVLNGPSGINEIVQASAVPTPEPGALALVGIGLLLRKFIAGTKKP